MTLSDSSSDSSDRQGIEDALRESEENFRLLVSAVQDYAIFMLDINGCVATWNEGAERIKGYSDTEVIGRHFSLFYTEDERLAGVPEHELRITRDTGRCEVEGWRVRKDGTCFLANVILTPLKDSVGALRGYAKVTRDISTRRQLEERFRRVVESAPSAMVMINTSGVIEMVNAQTEKLFDYRRSELLGQPVEMLVPQRFRHHHPEMRDGFMRNPLSRPMGAGRDLYGLRKDGSEFPVEIGLNPIEMQEGTMVLSVIVDISARKRMEERFRKVVESAPNAMVMVNLDGRIEMVNAQVEKVFGYRRGEILGQSVEILIPDRFRANHPGLRRSFFADPHTRPMGAGRDLFGLRKDGSEFPVEIGLNPIETEEGPMVLSAIVDISDRKQKEMRIQAALREKDVLLGEIHHRVKNNLHIIDSLLNLQSDRIPDQQVRSVLRDSQNRIRSMALIHQTLYQSKDFAHVDFAGVLESLVPNLVASYGLQPEHIALDMQFDEVLLSINQAIPCGLIVNELITNALKHAFGSGGGEIHTALSIFDAAEVQLLVSDNGVGIPEHVEWGKTGTLGLQLVQLLAEQLGGTITMQRLPAQFILRFPIAA